MAATIRLIDGTEATLIDRNGTWICADAELAKQLGIITFLLPHDYYPNPIAGLARAVAAEIGAEVIHADPVPPPVPGRTY